MAKYRTVFQKGGTFKLGGKSIIFGDYRLQIRSEREKRHRMAEKTQSASSILRQVQHIIEEQSFVDKNGKKTDDTKKDVIEKIQHVRDLIEKDDRQQKPNWLPGWLRKKEVQLYIPEKVLNDSIKLFGESLAKELKKRVSIECQIEKKNSLQTALPLLLVCPSGSRLGAHTDLALEDFQWDEPFIVIIINFGTEMSLPEIASSNKVPQKPAYEKIVFIDMAYNEDDKLYECDMNNIAYSKIKAFVDKKK